MATAAHASDDFWHRSLEDLLEAIENSDAKSFAIKLLTSAVPVAPVPAFPRFDKLHVYHLTHRDEGPTRFQLRLGIIQSDLEADAILAAVRQYYPNATKEVVDEADRTAVAQAVTAAQTKATAAAPAKSAAGPNAPKPAAAMAAKPAMSPRLSDPSWHIDELLPDLARLKAAGGSKPAQAAVAERVRAQVPSPVASTAQSQPSIKGGPDASDPPAVTSPSDFGTLQSLVDKIDTLVQAVETHAPAPTLTAAPAPAPPAVVPQRIAPSLLMRARVKAAAPPAPLPPAAPVAQAMARTSAASPAPIASTQQTSTQKPSTPKTPASIDSTQTVRALSLEELADAKASQWYVVQLMHSHAPIEPEQVPRLDIFSEYRLYAVCEAADGRPIHALRLGFFSSEIAAQAVAGYLGAHFATTDIKRVSIAERNRFADQVLIAKKDVGEEGRHTVIEFTTAPPALSSPAPPPLALPPLSSDSEGETRPETSSFWSRLARLGGG